MPFAQSGTSFHLFVYLFNNSHYFIYLLRGFSLWDRDSLGLNQGSFVQKTRTVARIKSLSQLICPSYSSYTVYRSCCYKRQCVYVLKFFCLKNFFFIGHVSPYTIVWTIKRKKNYFPFFCDLNPNLQHTIMKNLTRPNIVFFLFTIFFFFNSI